tara:strand:- start:756 stop:1109 length:354 start_codon:yes stop_codon:yes gene_type:complete
MKEEIATEADLYISEKPREHKITLPNGKVIKLWLREPTWRNYYDAMKAFTKVNSRTGKIQADLGDYYQSILKSTLVKSEPSIDAADMIRMKFGIGKEIENLLPQPGDMELRGDEAKN